MHSRFERTLVPDRLGTPAVALEAPRPAQRARRAHGRAQGVPSQHAGERAGVRAHRRGATAGPGSAYRPPRAVMDARGQPSDAPHQGAHRRAQIQDVSVVRESAALAETCMSDAGRGRAGSGAGATGFTALVLAGTRPGGDQLARAAGVSHKALAHVAGISMLARVLDTLRATAAVRRVVVCGIDRE